MLGHERRTRAVEIRIVGRPSRQAVDVSMHQLGRTYSSSRGIKRWILGNETARFNNPNRLSARVARLYRRPAESPFNGSRSTAGGKSSVAPTGGGAQGRYASSFH